MANGYVYMMSNRPLGVIYIGVTSDLSNRIQDHKSSAHKGFTAKYKAQNLVWFETHPNIVLAIQREKALKRYRREWKINLIEGLNPTWRDLSGHIFQINNEYMPHHNTKMWHNYN